MMQQKGRTEQILDRLQEMINNGQGSLAPGKVSLPKEELGRLILELSLTMETELKQYREITDKRAKVLKDAKKQADDIIYEAEQSASRIRISGRKTDVAPVRVRTLPEEDRRALDNANEIYAASLIYTDEMMAEMQDVIDHACEEITASYETAINDLKAKRDTIVQNRMELMEDLKSMEKEDRYQQIMEIGQLLSEELYHARRRAQGEDVPEQQEKPLSQSEKAEKTEQQEKPSPQPEKVEKAEQQEKPLPQSEQTEPPLPQVEEPEQTEQSERPETDEVLTAEETAVVKEDSADAVMDRWMKEQSARAAAVVDAALQENQTEEYKGDVAEITQEVSEAVKKDVQPNLSNSVIEAMKRAAKKAVLGMEDAEEDIFAGEYDEDAEEDGDEDITLNRTPTQPLDTVEINKRAAQPEPLTPEQERHQAFVKQHEQRVKAEEQKWLNAVYTPPLPDMDAVDPIVAMVLKEKEDARKHGV